MPPFKGIRWESAHKYDKNTRAQEGLDFASSKNLFCFGKRLSQRKWCVPGSTGSILQEGSLPTLDRSEIWNHKKC